MKHLSVTFKRVHVVGVLFTLICRHYLYCRVVGIFGWFVMLGVWLDWGWLVCLGGEVHKSWRQ